MERRGIEEEREGERKKKREGQREIERERERERERGERERNHCLDTCYTSVKFEISLLTHLLPQV